MRGVTERQRAVLDVIRGTVAERGFPPTLREIGARLGIRSTNGIADHLKALERKGLIVRDPMVSRGLRVLGEGEGEGMAKEDEERARRLIQQGDALLAAASAGGQWVVHPTPYDEKNDAQVRTAKGKLVAVVVSEEDATLIAQGPDLIRGLIAELRRRT